MNDNEPFEFADYFYWFKRVVGWDAILPLVVSLASIGIAEAFKHRPPADIIALAGLPVAGFLIRYVVGRQQIYRNGCGRVLRQFQITALVLGLFALAVVDFFTALMAFVPNGNDPPVEITLVCLGAIAIYLALAIFAMYPGHRRAIA